jgi:ABC-type transport system involved in cytochrome c biogenesis permease component
MLWTLLIKDLKRARRNPWPYLINLALPLCITGLIGLAFGPSSKDSGLGQIKMAVVDDDDSVLGSLLRGAMNQGDFKKHLEARFLERTDALKQIHDNKISAVLIIPNGFTRAYLAGEGRVGLELIKNPAQSFYPAILEELLRVAVTGLNAIARNLRSDLPEWKDVIEKEGRPDMRRIAGLLVRVGDKFEKAEHYLFPPLVGYETAKQAKAKTEGPGINIFAFLLPGMAAMFLLFLADHAIRDLYHENQARTLDRFRTLHDRLLPFVISKVVLAMALVGLGSMVMFGGGALIFGIHWEKPLEMIAVILAFGLFAAGFMAVIAALARNERRANALNSVLVMCLSFVGGSFFPARQLPPVFRDHISPLLPNYWFIESLRGLQSGAREMAWVWAVLKLFVFGLALVIAASWIFQRALTKGIRS